MQRPSTSIIEQQRHLKLSYTDAALYSFTRKHYFFLINIFINHICSLQFYIQYLFKYPSEQTVNFRIAETLDVKLFGLKNILRNIGKSNYCVRTVVSLL